MRFTNRAGTFCALALVALAAAPSLSTAQEEPPVGPPQTHDPYHAWTPFSWTMGPGASQQESPFTFTTSGPVILDVTDAFAHGDRFDVYDWQTYLGTSSQVNGPANFVPDPDVAFVHPGFSHFSMVLPAGSYSLTFHTVQITEGADFGTAYFRLTPQDIDLAQVPEPGTLILAACGVAGLAFPGLRRWTRRTAQPQPA